MNQPTAPEISPSNIETAAEVVARRDFASLLSTHDLGVLRRTHVTTLQVNLGKRCNQACLHCHVEAGPNRTENMSRSVVERVVELLGKSPRVEVVDLTGGAPELNPNFRWMVTQARSLGRTVIDRCNLTILFEPTMESLAAFLAEQGVQIMASLPCYTADNVNAQRGSDVFVKSIEGLKRLNALGYGEEGSGLELHLVYNPGGAFLPPPQSSLESRYRTELADRFDVRFNRLLTLTNLPVKRFATSLARRGELVDYLDLLQTSFNANTVDGLMCRETISVGWDGALYDCDFNQMLEMNLEVSRETNMSVFNIESLDGLLGRPITTGGHCLGCTAGCGSSCTGALT